MEFTFSGTQSYRQKTPYLYQVVINIVEENKTKACVGDQKMAPKKCLLICGTCECSITCPPHTKKVMMGFS